jgi:OOP family OmpA-OmpF porin
MMIVSWATANAQRNLNLKDFNTWSVQANLNSNFGNTDIVQNKPFYTSMDMNFGYGLRVTKFLTHNFGLSLDNYRSKLSGSNDKWSYNTDIRYQTSILAQFQTGNIRYINAFSKLQLYGYLGYGTVNFRAVAKNKDDASKNTDVTMNSQVIPIGMGVKYHLAENATLNLEYSMNKVDGDRIDGYSNVLTNYDNYSRFSIGFSWTFGNEDDLNLEWHDPRPRPSAQPYRKDTVVIIQRIPAVDSNSVANRKSEIDSTMLEAIKDSVRLDLLTTTIYYDFNKWNYLPIYNTALSDLALEAINNPPQAITIDSYCDTIGTAEHNAIVASRRAQEVKKQFIGFGIPESMLEITLHGEDDAKSPVDADNRKTIISLKRK